MKIAGYETHPAADLFPLIDGEEFESLVESVRTNGLREPIVLLDGAILDGRNRARACVAAEISLVTIDFVDGDPWDYVWDKNAERRHLAQGTKGVLWVVKEEKKTADRVKADANRKRSDEGKKYGRGHKKGSRSHERIPFICSDCGEDFGTPDPDLLPLWHCPHCDHHHGSDRSECNNCHKGKRPKRDRGEKTAQEGARKTGVSTATIKRAKELRKKSPAMFAQVAEGKAELNKALREVKRTEKHAEIAHQAKSAKPIGEIRPCPIVYADPPWQYGNTAGASAAEDEYPTMPLADICALQVPATRDAVLFLWATSPLLPEAMKVITAWGFTYKGSIIWDKDMGTGNWVLNCHELLLIAVRGDIPCPAPANRPKSVVRAPRGKHSAKPEAFAEMIERMFPGLPKVEMFARVVRAGWSAWGNQAA